MKRVAILTRVSTDEQARSSYSSLDTQREICEHYVRVQQEQDWQVVRVYEEAGFSGGTLRRPGIQGLLGDVRRGLIDVVISYKLDRIIRRLRDFYEFWETLADHGVTYVSATQSFDTGTPAGNLMLNVLLSFGEYERELTLERTMTKMRARAERGLYNGGWCPLGLRVEQQRLVPDPEEVDIIVAIYDAVIRHGSVGKARDEINQRGYRTKRRVVRDRDGNEKEVGGRPFSYDAIRNIIRNPAYKGALRYQGEVFEGKHPPIIPPDLWLAANDILARRSVTASSGLRTADAHTHLLKHLLRCGACGSAMTPYPSGKRNANGTGPYLYYTCTRVIKDGQRCDCPIRSLPARRFEDTVLRAFQAMADDQTLLARYLQAGAVADDEEATRCERSLRRLRDELSTTETALSRLVRVFESRDAVPEALRDRCIELEAKRSRIRPEVLREEARLEMLQRTVVEPTEVARHLRDLLSALEPLPLPDRKRLIQSYVTSVVVNPHCRPIPSSDAGDGVAGGGMIRTRALMVSVQMRSGPAGSPDPAGPEGGVNVRTGGSSDDCDSGSPCWTTCATGCAATSAGRWPCVRDRAGCTTGHGALHRCLADHVASAPAVTGAEPGSVQAGLSQEVLDTGLVSNRANSPGRSGAAGLRRPRHGADVAELLDETEATEGPHSRDSHWVL